MIYRFCASEEHEVVERVAGSINEIANALDLDANQTLSLVEYGMCDYYYGWCCIKQPEEQGL